MKNCHHKSVSFNKQYSGSITTLKPCLATVNNYIILCYKFKNITSDIQG